jgi:mannose-6-phosphate isomerase-like protein (cupin superfamily)
MRGMTMAVCGVFIAATCGILAFAQSRGNQSQEMLGGMVLRLSAPTAKSVAWPAANMKAGFSEMVTRKLESQRVLEGGVFNFNLRRETAAEEGATAHGKKADLYLIQSGEATLTTDGELINPKPPEGPEGDRDGSGIRNGVSRVVKAGDTIFIPAGVPHQITAVNGEVQFLLFRWDTR